MKRLLFPSVFLANAVLLNGSGLSRQEADNITQKLLAEQISVVKPAFQNEWAVKQVKIGDKVMKFDYRTFGRKPSAGWDLYISMHGGGGAPAQVNDSQWRNQIRLYQPPDSLYLVPRAPTNTWNLWHQSHIDHFFDRLIQGAVHVMGANPNRVYFMGYSAGGDGVYQLAPRMADRLAAASMMAGHPNDASPLGLRNIGFAIHVGALDSGYNRNKVAAKWAEQLASLQKRDPEGYLHAVKIHKGLGHWMKLRDAEAIPWMSEFTRNPIPERIVWKQSKVTHSRFYWLALPKDQVKPGSKIVAEIEGQVVRVLEAEGVSRLNILLNDQMLNLDQPVTILHLEKKLFHGKLDRNRATIARTIAERLDHHLAFSSEITVKLE